MVENKQTKIWLPLAHTIREELSVESRIVSVTGSDPTLLNLARRQGWLASSKSIDQVQIKEWISEGATFITGSLNWDETYIRKSSSDRSSLSDVFKCKENYLMCPSPPNYTYLIPLKEIIDF